MDLSENKLVLTRQGYEDIQRELDEILTVKRPEVVNRIREARQLGDLSENFDYQDAKRTQGMLEARIRELQAILAEATVVENTNGDGCVGVGSKVVVKDLEDGFEDEYTIVGPTEASPAEGKISHASCMGSALMGRKAGDKITVDSPGGQFSYEIVSVS
ncbi:MAG TPA: transcription elongation factor GreA [Armatimonadota bacterium]|nr:transcription elongation factor GreA [Armatimonadota bacterium]